MFLSINNKINQQEQQKKISHPHKINDYAYRHTRQTGRNLLTEIKYASDDKIHHNRQQVTLMRLNILRTIW